jgi:hypothetical protein
LCSENPNLSYASVFQFFLSQEPRYEYDFPLPYIRSWNNYYVNTIQKGFNEFLDRHRDPKDIQKEVLEVRMVYYRDRCCGSGSGIRCFFDPWIREPGWKKNSRSEIRIRDDHPRFFLELRNSF